MAVTVTEEKRGVVGDMWYVVGRLAFDNSYAASGEPFTPATIGMTRFYFCAIETQGGIVFNWDRTNRVIHAYRTGAGADAVLSEVGGTVDISAVATAVEFFALGY